MRKALLLLLASISFVCAGSAGAALEVSLTQARAILSAEVERGALSAYKGSYIDFDAGAQIFGQDFYSFSAETTDPKAPDLILGYFAVNIHTGTSWDAWGCMPIHSKLVFSEMKMKHLRDSMGRATFLRLAKKRPVCFNDF